MQKKHRKAYHTEGRGEKERTRNREKVKRVCEAHGVHVLLVSDETRMCTPTKRSASEAGLQESTPSRRKRTRCDTPTRRRLAELVQTSTSPAVEVSKLMNIVI